MCRYSLHIYKEPYACFKCRKMFKQTATCELPEHVRPKRHQGRTVRCPQCGDIMADMGKDFRTPKKRDVKQWEKVRILFEHGYTYKSCGCNGPGFRPAELKDVKDFLDSSCRKSEGEILLERIEKK